MLQQPLMRHRRWLRIVPHAPILEFTRWQTHA